jgi:hypothetical protein
VIVVATLTQQGIQARVDIEAGVQLAHPVHLCFGLLDPDGVQSVQLELTLHAGATATVWSHCLFSTAESAKHAMQASVVVEEGAALDFQESHYHGLSGGIQIWARARVQLARRARYRCATAPCPRCA